MWSNELSLTINSSFILGNVSIYIENNECVNKYIPTRTAKERYEDNKDKILDRNRQYHKGNRDTCKILDQKKQYRENNKDKITARGERTIS